MPRAESHVLVTGVTGFLGKVVLEALVRRADELGVTRIYLLIRPKRDRTPQERFTSEVVASDCFRRIVSVCFQSSGRSDVQSFRET